MMNCKDLRYGDIIYDKLDKLSYKVIDKTKTPNNLECLILQPLFDNVTLPIDYISKNCVMIKENDLGVKI